MKMALFRGRQGSAVDLTGMVSEAGRQGLATGWTAAENWPGPFREAVRAELRILERRANGKLGPEPATLFTAAEALTARKANASASLAGYLQESTLINTGAERLHVDPLRAATIAVVLALVATAMSAVFVKLPWQAYSCLALAGVLFVLRPFGVACRRSIVRLGRDIFALCALCRMALIDLRLRGIRAETAREQARREQAERWVNDHLEWILATYDLQRSRGEKARQLAAQG